ncbi:hypothetical protein [Runella slithyformis]|uniref:Uncharacterized protein n=1 Tax=Runella slithyformis (strain ATCC 29530 / DSM 19594 / LMG 11500 / NCIMB 11436 / LSU 4) TaxID=761193 RepID=A0A7U3ZNH5_RUNSL|nr:hypothetical protein [Runella slithyformis]AEI50467.1 hypothetical protein Runsl_4121 [Runella slithyformis DSM 19594]
MNCTHQLSSRASHYRYHAMTFIFLMKITKVFIGIMVGSALQKGSSPWVLMGMLIVGNGAYEAL